MTKELCICGHSRAMHRLAFPHPCKSLKGKGRCPCKEMQINFAPVVKPDFTEEAKTAAGVITVHQQIQMFRDKIDQLTKDQNTARVRLSERVAGIIAMFEEGRRGDAMKALRSLLIAPALDGRMQLKPQSDDGPGAA